MKAVKFLGVITALLVVVIIFSPSPKKYEGTYDPTECSRGANKQKIWYKGEAAIKSQLKDPSSAEFEHVQIYRVDMDDNKLRYVYRVKAKNSFNAYVVSTWELDVKVNDCGEYVTLLSFIRK